MNDRFKFRVWNNKMQKFHMVFSMHGIVNDTLEGYAKDDNFVLEQCTGLKDKNGKLIYEGDIVKLSSDREVVCPVVWDNEETGFCVKYKKELYRFNPYKKYHLIEVIGNIHENADLLEVGGK